MTTAKVYQAIAEITQQIGEQGIAKDRKNQQQGYSFRGIDDIFNALSPLLATNKLCILPRVLSREQTERQTAKGGALFYTVVEVEFDFVSAEDGSKHTIKTYGEAMDSADKSTNKAMSAAYKYAVMQSFCIPTEGDNDADLTTHEPIPRSRPQGLTDDDMDTVGFAMEEASDFDALKSIFGPAFSKANDSQKTALKKQYEGIKSKNKWGLI